MFGVLLRLLGFVAIKTTAGEREFGTLHSFSLRVKALKDVSALMRDVLSGRDCDDCLTELVQKDGKQTFVFPFAASMIDAFTESSDGSSLPPFIHRVQAAIVAAENLPASYVKDDTGDEPSGFPEVKTEGENHPREVLHADVHSGSFRTRCRTDPVLFNILRDLATANADVAFISDAFSSCNCTRSAMVTASQLGHEILSQFDRTDQPPDPDPQALPPISTFLFPDKVTSISSMVYSMYANLKRQFRLLECDDTECATCRTRKTTLFKRRSMRKPVKKGFDPDLSRVYESIATGAFFGGRRRKHLPYEPNPCGFHEWEIERIKIYMCHPTYFSNKYDAASSLYRVCCAAIPVTS